MINFLIGLILGVVGTIIIESTKHYWEKYVLESPDRKKELLTELGKSHRYLMKNEIEGCVRELPGIIIIGIDPNIKNEFVVANIFRTKNIKKRLIEISNGEDINKCMLGVLHLNPLYKVYEIDSPYVRSIKYFYLKKLFKPVCLKEPENDQDAFIKFFK